MGAAVGADVKDLDDLIPTLPRVPSAFLISDERDAARPDDEDPTAFAGKGPFLEDDAPKVADRVIALWKAQDIPMNRRDASWRMYAGWREGKRGLAIQKDEDTNQWRVWSVPGASTRAMPDKTDELVRKTVANLLADDPLPECEPAQDTTEAREAAEFQERILSAETGEAQLNLPRLLRLGLDKAGTWCSSFFWVTPNPMGKGFEPETILADPHATDAAQPLMDPTTGQISVHPVERYVTEDGQITDDPAQAKRHWKPGLDIDVLSGRHVRFLPETVQGVEDAAGVLVAKYTTFGALKQLPAVRAMSATEQRRLTTWKLPEGKRLLPRWARDYLRRQTEADKAAQASGEELPDSAPCLVLSLYLKGSTEYPDGAYLMVSEKTVLHRQTWYETYPTRTGQRKGECMMIPVAQLRWWDDAQHDDPYGRTVVEKLGPWDEVYASQLSSELDWAFRFNNPNIFLPASSPVKGKALRRRDGTPIIIRRAEDKPMYEEVPRWPVSSLQLREDAKNAMDDAAGRVGSALDAPNAKSGTQANAILAQSNVNLTGTRNNVRDCYERLLRVIAQHMKVYYTVADKVRYVGEDASYREREWSQVDLSDAVTIRLARGSMTGMNRMAKNAYITQLVQLGLDPAEARRLILSNVSAEIGAEDNPHVTRVRRQITTWFDGPPEGWVQAARTYQAQLHAYQQAQQQAQQQQHQQQAMQQATQQQAAAAHAHAQAMERQAAPQRQQVQIHADAADRERAAVEAHTAKLHAMSETQRAGEMDRLARVLTAHRPPTPAPVPPPVIEFKPVINVPPPPAPVVQVAAPAVTVQVPASSTAPAEKQEKQEKQEKHPIQRIPSAAQEQDRARGRKRKRTHTFTDPTGKKWIVHSEDEDG